MSSIQTTNNELAWEKIFKFSLALLAAVGGVLGVIVAYHNNRADHEEVNIQKIITTKLEWQQRINNAANQIRLARINSLLDCKFSKKTSLQKSQDVERAHARFSLFESITGVKTIFGNLYGEKIEQNTSAYIKYDEKNDNVCAPGSPPDASWRTFVKEINVPMQDSINQDLQKLDQ